MTAEEIGNWYSDYVVCPYCGNEHLTSEFLGDEYGKFVSEADCDKCGKSFGYEILNEPRCTTWQVAQTGSANPNNN